MRNDNRTYLTTKNGSFMKLYKSFPNGIEDTGH